MNLIDMYKTLHPKTAEYTFFSSAHGTFSRVDNMLGHVSNVSINLRRSKSYQVSFLITTV